MEVGAQSLITTQSIRAERDSQTWAVKTSRIKQLSTWRGSLTDCHRPRGGTNDRSSLLQGVGAQAGQGWHPTQGVSLSTGGGVCTALACEVSNMEGRKME